MVNQNNMKKTKSPTPEEILKKHIDKQSMDELCENIWPDMLDAMEDYHKEALRSELIAYDKWLVCNLWDNILPTPEEAVDEYLKHKK